MKLQLLILCLSGTALIAQTEAPSYRGARNLCAEHIVGNVAHISWTSVATRDDVATVVAFYEKALGRKAATGDRGERTFEPDKDRRVSIYPASKNDHFPHCETKPAKDEKTVILSSLAIR